MDQSQRMYSVSESRISDEGFHANKSLHDLVEKVVRGFVTSLQKDSVDVWESFNEVLEIIQPYSSLIEENAQLMHYVERAHNHFCENPNCGLDVNALAFAFPREMQIMQQKVKYMSNRKGKFPSGSPQPEICLPIKKMDRKHIKVPKGTVIPSSDIYDGNIEKISYVFPEKELHIDDLRKSLPFVVCEIGLREASWGRPLGSTAMALNVDLADMVMAPTKPQDPGTYLNDDTSTSPSTSLKSSLDNKIIKEEKAERRALTGREVVEKFVKGSFLGASKFAYLNVAPSKHYDPYNLVVVPRNKKEPEHYVVSSHAILHVVFNGPSELHPLDEWYKEALLFSAILKFNFFKNFLVNKMFLKWKHIKKMSQFRALCQNVGEAMLSSTPTFGSALIRISSLIQDLDQVQFLPLDDLRCKRLQEFNDVTVNLLDDAKGYLKMLFAYCLSVINKTSENCFEYLDYCKEQLQRKDKNQKGSLSLAKERKAIKEQNMKLAHHDIYQLEKFVKLVEQILLAKLLTLARHNICTFVNEVLDSEEIKDKGFFLVSLQFDKTDKLVLVPSRNTIQGSLFFSIESVLNILCQSSESLDTEFCESGQMDDSSCASSERSDPKQTVGASPNRPHSFLMGQSPRTPSAPSTSLPALSVIGHHGRSGELDNEVDRAANDTTVAETVRPVGKTEQLKNLLAESLQLQSPQRNEEDCPESPKACVSSTGGLLVKGKQIRPQRALTSPLSKTKLDAIVQKDEEILAAMSKAEKIVNTALEEVDVFCREHEWIVEISDFVRTWNTTILASWRGRPPGKIQKQLGQIKTWIEQLRNVTKSFVTNNGLLFVDCSSIHNDVIPKLDAIFRQLTKMVTKDLLKMSADFSVEVTQLAEKLSNKRRDLKAFAEFILIQKATKEKVPSLQVKVEYIKSLFETWDSWEKFLLSLQESSDFLLVETPQVLRDLEETIMTLEHQARVLGEKATSGEFLIPENNPTMILSQLRQLREKFWSLLNQLDNLIEYRAVICGRKYDKSYLLSILNKMDVRYELWKYYDVSAHTINDWLQMPFRKMNVKKVTEKITEWQVAAQNLKSSLFDGDEVYEWWIKQMESFMKDFPLLQQLFNDALKQRHWKALFVGMGQQYDANWQFTIADLFSFKLGLYKDLINSVCSGALHEYALELQLRSLVKVWTDKDFKLAKHFARTRSSLDSETDSLPGKSPTRQGTRSRQNYSKVSDVYILTGDDELKCLIEDNRVTLQLMLVSPYVADLKPTVEAWMKHLEQLEEILELWVACQKKWLYLSLVFTENSGPYTKAAADRFEQIDNRFKEFMQSVLKDSKVLAILAKKRGEKGYRELQGEALRSMLLSLLKEQEELLKTVEKNMEKVREAFPRLYFLSDSEVLDVMVISRDPRKLVPVVRKCFPGIKSIRFGLPEDSTTKLSTALDAALNAHLLQVTSIEGDFGEVMALTDPIAPCMDSQTWLKVLEKSMKTALMMNLTECMVTRSLWRKHNTTAVSSVLEKGEYNEDVCTEKSEVSNTDIECRRSETPWFLKYPSQCLRSVEAAVWFNDISHALSSKDKNHLKAIRSFTNCRVEDYAKVLGGKEYTWLTNIQRSLPTLESLLVCAIHQRDVVDRLLACKAVCLHCFEWQSCLQHHISLKEVFSTTYCSGLPGTSLAASSQAVVDQIPLDKKYETKEYSICLLGSEFPCGFEYLSEPVSMVVTPLTERCFLTLTMALKYYSCGTTFGCSGTGKTETIKELAKIMGRHLVFFNCSHSMANAVTTRLLTGMILSGSWICFEEAHNLPQRMLSTLGEYLRCIRESYKCLLINRSNQYFVRGTSKADGLKDAEKKSSHLRRRNSLTTLDPLTVPATVDEAPTDVGFSSETKKSTSVSRRYSIACGRNIDKTQFYENEQPLPISIPLTPGASMTDCALFSRKDKEVTVAYQQPSYFSLGNIVFNGMLIKADPMAGSFMTIIPTTDGYLNVPENLKVSLRTVAMMVPDMKRILEVWLLCNGFSDVGDLAQKISFFIQVIRAQFSSEYDIQTSGLKTAIRVAGNKLRLEQSISATTEAEATASEDELEFKPSKEEVEGIASATSFLDEFESRTNQESAVVFGLFSVLCSKFDENDKKSVCDIIDTVFTHTVLTSSTQTNTDRVAEAVREQLKAESLQCNMDLVSKVIQLYLVLQTNHAVILMGSSGTGKTTIYQTLCRAINSLNTPVTRSSSVAEDSSAKSTSTKVEQKFPKINLSVLFPRAMNENELFGWIDPVTKLWVDGILVKRARNAQAVKTASDSLSSRMKRERERSTSTYPNNYSESDFHQWVVLDGPLDHGSCVDQMNSLFDGSRTLSLASGEMIPLSETMSFLLELDDLKNAAPSVVSRCGIVFCPDDTVGWKSIFKSWLKGAHIKWNISIRGLGIVSSLMEHCVEKTLTFLSNHGASILYANFYDSQQRKMGARGVHEIQRFLAIFSSLFDKHILRDNDDSFNILDQLKEQRYSSSCSSSETASGRSSSIPASDANTVISSFAYAFIWAFGGDLHESCIEVFNDFVKGLLSTGPHPHHSLPPASVFDCHLDFQTGTLLSSTERLSGATRTIASSYVVVPRDEVYFSLLDLLVSASKPVLLVGPPGSGKTSFMQNLINPRYKYTRVSLAHGMTTQLLQENIEAKAQHTKRRQSVINNPTLLAQASRNLFFLDDLNLAPTDGTTSNTQPSTEVIRSLLSLGGLYDSQRLCLKPLSHMSIVGAAVPPGCPGTGGGVTSFPISPRLTRLMVVLSFHPVSCATLRSIYRNLFQTWLEDFPAYSLTHHQQLAKAISSSTVYLFETVLQELRPTPVNPHYIFTHHDVARVLQGMMLFSSRTKNRSRLKVRHKRRMNNGEMSMLNDQSLSYHDVGNEFDEKENNLHQDKSWPMVTCKETLVSMSLRTPAVLAPMIRVLLRLWCHECSRVFSDRLIGEDKLWFSSTLHKTAIQQFCETSLYGDEKDSIAIGVDKIIAKQNKDPLMNSLEEDVSGDEDIKTLKNEESGEDESFLVDDVETGEEHTTAEDDNEKTGDQIVQEHTEVDDLCGDPHTPPEAAQIVEEKPELDSFIIEDNSVDEIQFKSQEPALPRTAPSKQRVVTFEDMSKEHVYRGPLISPDQFMEQGEDLSKILFCRHFVSTTQETGHDHDKGYNEYSVAALAEGINRCQQLYNSQEAQPLDLVFFEQAVRHAARLSRCLSLSSGHAIFFSQFGHGRKSLVLLASFTANCKLMTLKSNSHEDSRQRIKAAIYLAGLQGKPVVLYVPEDIDKETMLDVCSLMSEGNSPGVYSLNELSTICGELIPGGQRGRRNENMAIAQERFFRRVRTNLHVILSLEHPSDKTHALDRSTFSLYPFLLTRTSGIDVYQPWHHNSLTKVCTLRLQDVEMDTDLKYIVDIHLTSVTSVMSFIHRSSLETITKQFGFRRYKCYSPATFIEFVDMFGKYCNRIWREEQGKIVRCNKALKKVEEANGQINEMQRDLDSFVPILRNAEQEVKNCLELVESLQSEYTKGREKCKQQEGEIEKMMAPIEELERLAKIELDRVSPVFRSAYDALRALNVYDVEEIRSYRTPPDQVVLVVNAVCLLFGKEESWEEGKVLFSREDFIKDLEFFNMKAISDKTFCRLKEYVDNPKFVPNAVTEGSLAARSVCVWIRAVYHFCVVYREYFPKQQRVIEAKKILEEAVSFLGDLRVHCNEIKAEVEGKIEEYKEKVHHVRSIEKQIQITEQRKARAVSLVRSMSMHVKSWEEVLRGCQYHIRTLAGDALLTAACVCYQGPMDQETREKLLGDWKISCHGSTVDDKSDEDDTNEEDGDPQMSSSGRKMFTSITRPCVKRVPVRSDFNLKGILTTEEELYNWRHSGLPSNSTTVENALLMRSICELASSHWPLLIDTDLQSYMWVKCLHQSISTKDQEDFDIFEMNPRVENPVDDEDVSLPVSPCLTNADQDSTEDRSTNYEESDSTTLNSNQSSRRASAAAGSGPLIREELARELNIQTSPLDYTSTDSASTDVDFDDERIMIISATDRQRDVKMCGAVSIGATVILVDVERRKLGTRLDNLLKRNTFTDKNGKRKIRIGSRCIDYHPSFRLYLYSNMPLELTTSAISLPVKKCLVINMALSGEGLQELLLTDVLSLERPEYEGQQRSLEADIHHHKQQIKNAEKSILDQVINLKERLLQNGAIPGALTECDELCDMAREQLEESKALCELAKEKQEDYSHVSEHGAALLTIVSKLSKLHPYYQVPFQISLRLFHDVIMQRRRGTRSTGSSLARCAELITYITRSMCSRVARFVFSDHYDVFTFLVAVEKLRLAGQLSEDEWKLFCHSTSEVSTENRTSDASPDDRTPSWISPEIWTGIIELDVLPGYHGLKESIQSNNGLWKEYFELPPTLMAPTPSNFHQLSVFQRVLLWKTFKKDQLHNVAKDLVLYQLGTNASAVTSFSIDEAYQDSTCITPFIIFIPEAQYTDDWRKQNLKDPVDEIVALANRHEMKDKLRFLGLCGEVTTEASQELRKACEHGLWLVIQNCHLIAKWLPELLDIFHQITLSGSKEQIISKHGIFELDTNPYTVTSCAFNKSLVMHPRFRLWLITAPEIATPLPAVLIRYSIKLTWDDKLTFENSVRHSFLTVWNKTKRSDKLFKELQIKDVQAEPLLPYLHSLALFHCILHRRCRYGSSSFNIPYHWHHSDLSWGLDAVHLLKCSVLCSCLVTTCPSSALRQTISILYGGQVLDLLDWTSIFALSEKHLSVPNLATQTTYEIAEKSTDILFSRLPLTINLNDVGLNENLSTEHDIHVSNKLATNIFKAFGTFPKSPFCLKPVSYFEEILDAFVDIKSIVHPDQPSTNEVGKDESSFNAFLYFEIFDYLTLVNTITSQLQGIIKGLRGDISFTSDMRELAMVLCDERIPSSWSRRSKACSSLPVWIVSLKSQLRTVVEYSQHPSDMPLTVNIAAFLNKQRLFYALLVDWSKANGRPVHMTDISIEVCRSSSTRQLTAADGVYLTGLVLCNASWNDTESCLEEQKEGQNAMPCLLLRPMGRNERQVVNEKERGLYYQHDCPVYFYDDLSCRSSPNTPFSHVPLRSRLPCHICQERQVFLTCSM